VRRIVVESGGDQRLAALHGSELVVSPAAEAGYDHAGQCD
jgi:hypothetical protein